MVFLHDKISDCVRPRKVLVVNKSEIPHFVGEDGEFQWSGKCGVLVSCSLNKKVMTKTAMKRAFVIFSVALFRSVHRPEVEENLKWFRYFGACTHHRVVG